MDKIKKVLGLIINSDFSAISEDRNTISAQISNVGQDYVGKLSVSRHFELDDETLLPTMSVSVYMNDAKVYGYSGSYLTDVDTRLINQSFAVIDREVWERSTKHINEQQKRFLDIF